MKKSIIIVDLLLIVAVILMVIAKITDASYARIVQPIFLLLIIIHIVQHWKTLVVLTKRLFKK